MSPEFTSVLQHCQVVQLKKNLLTSWGKDWDLGTGIFTYAPENQPFEDVSPIRNGVFPLSC